jgi:hypothetical protein
MNFLVSALPMDGKAGVYQKLNNHAMEGMY